VPVNGMREHIVEGVHILISVYKHYTVTDMKVTELTWRQLHGKCSPPYFVTNSSMWFKRKPRGERSTSSRCLPSWLSLSWRNMQIQMHWLWKWLESYN